MIIAPGQELKRNIFLIFFNMKVRCVFSLESPHRGDSNEYTQYTTFIMNKKNTLNYPKPAAMDFSSKGLKNEFETAVVNEPSVFEPLEFYCTYIARNVRLFQSPVGILSEQMSGELFIKIKFQAIFQLQTKFKTDVTPAGSIEFDAKRLKKVLSLIH